MQYFHNFVPPKSVRLLQCWVDELGLEVNVSKPRKTKLGDFKVRGNKLIVSVNNNLNKYAFLITFTHELAHAFVFKKHKNSVTPHGDSWKLTFKSMMLNFLTPDYFPKDILKILSNHIITPKASTFSDVELSKVLRNYDTSNVLTISDLSEGVIFKMDNGKTFQRGIKLRKRFKCVEIKTSKVYLFHPLAEVKSVQ
jgi:hypothetical protein